MNKVFLEGKWLLLDGAGPVYQSGIIEEGQWVKQQTHDSDFLEWLLPATQSLLTETGRRLEDLSGILYAEGPGSTLGLRLAALFARSLLQRPTLSHWKVFQYNNLQLALSAREQTKGSTEAIAPWRKDRFHHCQKKEGGFKMGFIPSDMAETREIPAVLLGKPPAKGSSLDWIPYPFDSVPQTLQKTPSLLHQTDSPTPYTAEATSFARWSQKRHPAK